MSERRQGHSKLVWDKEAQALRTVDPNPPKETRAIHDPFLNKEVEISSRLVDRLRGKYANGPTLPNGEPEFGWRQFETPPIQHEAAAEIERLRAQLARQTPVPDHQLDDASHDAGHSPQP